MNSKDEFRRRMMMAFPIMWMLMIFTLKWSGVLEPITAHGAVNPPAAPQAAPATQPAWQTDWPSEPPRNLFLTRLENFPRDVGSAQQPMRPGDASGAKSPAYSADQNHIAPATGLADDASAVHLESIMMHPAPRALVNGQIVGEGDYVGSYRVVRITLSQMVIEKQGAQFTITLK